MTVRWITPLIGTAAATSLPEVNDFHVVDVRELVDKEGNVVRDVQLIIEDAAAYVSKGEKIVICCDYGISRSNAVACGVISISNQISFSEALMLVMEKTGIREIKLGPLEIVRKAVEGEIVISSGNGRRRVLVTGSNGFIGQKIVSRLKEHYEVITPGSTEIDLESGSTLLNELCKNQSVDSVIHLANPRIYTSNIALGKTLSMLRNVLEVCSSLDIPLIYPSSWEVYSGYVGTIRVNESTPLYPRGPYGESKYLAEVMIEYWENTTNLKCAVIRSSALYGEGSTKPRFIYNFISKCEKDSEIVTHKYLNDRAGIDLLHVDDFVNALEKVYEQKFLGTLNIGSGTTTSTYDLAIKVKEQMKSNSNIREKMIDSTTPIVAMDIRKATDILGWNPRIDLNIGLGTLIESQGKRNKNE